MAELDKQTAPHPEEKSSARSGGRRIVALVLILLLAAGAAFGFGSGAFYRFALRELQRRGDRQEEKILALRGEQEEQEAQLRQLSEESAGKDARLKELDAQREERNARLQELTEEGARKEARLRELNGQLAAARAPLDYQAAMRETPPEAALASVALPDSLENGEALRLALLRELLGTAYLELDPISSSEVRRVCRIRTADGQLLGRVVFAPADKSGEDLSAWEAEEESFDFTPFLNTASVIVPPDYKVYQGDTLLGRGCIREKGIPYECLSYCGEDFSRLPTMVRYVTPPTLGEITLRVLDEQGRELAPEELREERFLDRCPEEVRERIEAFVPEFIELYMLFSADIGDSAIMYFTRIRPMVAEPDSPLFIRMQQAFEGLGYTTTRDAVFRSAEVERILDLGGGRYAVDLRYVTEITGYSSAFEPVVDELQVQLILEDVEGKLLAEALYYLDWSE